MDNLSSPPGYGCRYTLMANPFETQLESAIAAYDTAMSRCKYDDGSDMKPAQHHQLFTSCVAAIERAVGR